MTAFRSGPMAGPGAHRVAIVLGFVAAKMALFEKSHVCQTVPIGKA